MASFNRVIIMGNLTAELTAAIEGMGPVDTDTRGRLMEAITGTVSRPPNQTM